MNFAQGAGADIFCDLFCFYLPVGRFSTHFDGEIESIFVSLQQLSIRQSSFEQAVILSDSTSALQALSSNQESKSPRIGQCKSLLSSFQKKVHFQWVPSHCGIEGNEKADFLAKKGCEVTQLCDKKVPFHSSKLEINRAFRHSFRRDAAEYSRDKPWRDLAFSSRCVPDAPRSVATACFRLLTGHDCLQAYLFRFKIVSSPVCTLCDSGQIMNASHLDNCSALTVCTTIFEKFILESEAPSGQPSGWHLKIIINCQRLDFFFRLYE